MTENLLISWLSRIDLTRVIHHFENLNITKIQQLKNLTDEDISKIDLNEVERTNLK